MTLWPEALFSVSIDEEAITSRHPKGTIEGVTLSAISGVFVETNESGPWGMDVWWIVEGRSTAESCCFPQGATGEDEVLTWLQKLPGFQIRGMNCAENQRFECWPNPEP
jgi:hypothetical protein